MSFRLRTRVRAKLVSEGAEESERAELLKAALGARNGNTSADDDSRRRVGTDSLASKT